VIWDEIFTALEWGRYPPEELIRFMARHYYKTPNRGNVKVLELGCGPGANLWYLAREGFNAWGVDLSEVAIAHAKERLLREKVEAWLFQESVMEISKNFQLCTFDAVIDVCCLQHLDSSVDIEAALAGAKAVLKVGGRIFSMLLASGSSDLPFEKIGQVNRFTLSEVEELFSGFEGIKIGYSERSIEEPGHYVKHWIVEAIK